MRWPQAYLHLRNNNFQRLPDEMGALRSLVSLSRKYFDLLEERADAIRSLWMFLKTSLYVYRRPCPDYANSKI